MTKSSYALALPAMSAQVAPFVTGAERFKAYAICSILAVAWTLFAGKDVPWDALHYHVYAGYSVFNDRLVLDFFPAGTQTYLNPYAHVPLYLMVQAGWSSVAIGVAFALLQSAMLWMTWELARAVCGTQTGNGSRRVAWAAVVMALLNPIFLQALGSSFTDITTGAFALAGYVALVHAYKGTSRFRLVAVAGACLGVASALKLSNAMFALLPASALVVGCGSTTRQRIQVLLLFVVCSAMAIIAVNAPWAIQLDRAFGNPFFPMLDGMFRTPPISAVTNDPGTSRWDAFWQLVAGMRDPRFLPWSIAEALARPFDMFSARRYVHTEPVAPDLRYAGLIVVAMLGAMTWIVRRSRVDALFLPTRGSNRAYLFLSISLAISWIIWLSISGNSRYFIPMASIAGTLLVVGLYRLLAHAPRRIYFYAILAMIGVQVVFLSSTRDLRWSPQPWQGTWLQVSVPPRLQQESQLYLPLDPQSQSFLLPWLAPGSAFLGVASGIGTDGYIGQRVRSLVEANVSRLRMLKVVKEIDVSGEPVAFEPTNSDYPLRRLGMQVDPDDCEFIAYKGNPSVIERSTQRSGPHDEIKLYACRVVLGGGLTDSERASKRVADEVLDAVEEACPELFGQYRGSSSWRSGTIWRRNYGDLALWVNDEGWVRFTDLIRGGGDRVPIGRVEDWRSGSPQLNCWRKGGRGYVELAHR